MIVKMRIFWNAKTCSMVAGCRGFGKKLFPPSFRYQNLEQCISTMDPQNIVWGSVRSRGISTQTF